MALPAEGLAQEKEAAAVSPLAALGEIAETQQRIIFNSLLDKLSGYYTLISQEQFQRAQETAFEELEDQQCTEAQCIRKIQELLQIENLFVLQVVRDGQDTQLSLTLVTLEEKKVKSDYCSKCDTPTLNERVSQLVDKLLARSSQPVPPAAAEPEPPPDTEPVESPEPETPDTPSSSRWVWHTFATTLALGAGGAAYQASQQHQALTEENTQLEEDIARVATQEEYDQKLEQYQQNQEQQNTLRQNIIALGTLSALAFGWELYLLFTSPDEEPPPPFGTSGVLPQIQLNPSFQHNHYAVSLRWTW